MSATAQPGLDPDQVHHATVASVEATATAYTEDASVDVDRRLREELEQRGVSVVDRGWLAETAHRIRSGHHVSFDDPGSAGG